MYKCLEMKGKSNEPLHLCIELTIVDFVLQLSEPFSICQVLRLSLKYF